jgi:3-hydroxyacyl-[acyl-carrier-protein] dehydratase
MQLNREQINNLIPQSPPFLLCDNVVDSTEKSLYAEYTFTPTEDYFKGHFPNDPIVPGVLLCECCLQSGAVWMALQKSSIQDQKAIVTKMDKVKFKNFVRPSEKLSIYVEVLETIENYTLMKGKITRDNTLIMTMEFMVGVTK